MGHPATKRSFLNTSNRNKTATYLCYIILALFAISLTSISPLLPEISSTFSLNLAKAGSLFTAQFTGFMLFIIIGGFLADRIGKKPVIAAASFFFALSLALFSITKSYLAAIITMFFVGGFGGILESMTTAMVFDLNLVKRSYYVNLSQVFFGFGAIIGPFAAGLIISLGVSWRVYYYVLVVLVLITAIVFTSYKTPETTKTTAVTIKDIRGIFKNKKFIFVCLCMIFYTGSEVGGWGWLSTLLKENMNFSIAKAGLAVSVFWMSMTLGRMLCGPLTLKYKIRDMVIILAGLSAVSTLLSVFIDSELFIWIIVIAMGFTYSSQFSLIVDYGTQNSTISSGITVSILIGSGSIGSMVIPYLMGIAGDSFDLGIAMLIPSVLLSFVAIIFIAFRKKEKFDNNSFASKPQKL